MSKSICTTIQRELDEMALGEDSSVASVEHLAQCDECRDVSPEADEVARDGWKSGTVAAPPILRSVYVLVSHVTVMLQVPTSLICGL